MQSNKKEHKQSKFQDWQLPLRGTFSINFFLALFPTAAIAKGLELLISASISVRCNFPTKRQVPEEKAFVKHVLCKIQGTQQ